MRLTRTDAEREASRLLFDDADYVPHRPDGTFSLGGEWITYNELVGQIGRAQSEDASRKRGE